VPREGRLRPRLSILALAAALLVLVGTRLLPEPVTRRAGPPMASELAGRSNSVVSAATAAESTFRAAVATIARAKRDAGVAAEPAAGPGASPLIGAELTPLVTTLGSLEAKRVASSPAWARVMVEQLAARGVGRGSYVTAGFSGSFPGLNLAVITACQALGADLVAVSSVTASTFGASEPGFTWPEMEAHLVRNGLVTRATVAVSVGGANDRGEDLEPEAMELARQILARSTADLGARMLRPTSFQQAVAERLALYRAHARGRPIALYVNSGGTDASLGRSESVLRLQSGFVRPGRFDQSRDRGVVAHMAELDVPILMLLNIRDLALRWGVTEPRSE